mmetsp:Transcript_15429/g.26330  ORF Transcript_15429/g.26330 Transcript_15429/m.26330 type:complete len:103 (-) Transcript_15429:271-579(-)
MLASTTCDVVFSAPSLPQGNELEQKGNLKGNEARNQEEQDERWYRFFLFLQIDVTHVINKPTLHQVVVVERFQVISLFVEPKNSIAQGKSILACKMHPMLVF